MVASMVSNTTAYPWSTVVQVVSTFPSGKQFIGSGTIVDRNDVLTAAHLVYKPAEGGRATFVEVIPGRNGDARPYGSYWASEFLAYDYNLDGDQNFMTSAEVARDVALLSFAVELGARTGWMGMELPGAVNAASLTGYPERTPANAPDASHMWSDAGTILNNGDGTLSLVGIFAAPGDSGGPVWVDTDPGPGLRANVAGVVSAGGVSAAATRGFTVDAFSTDRANNPQVGAIVDKIRSDNALLSGRLFDAVFYLDNNPDVRGTAIDSRAHYTNHGWREGRDPNRLFDTDGYLATYADVRAAGVNPLEHYFLHGWREGRDPSTAFDTGSYLAAYRDVAASGLNPLDHYLRFGQAEGRLAFGDGNWL